MTDLQKCYDKLNSYTNQNLTTKELNELGITKYFINKLTEKGKLEKVKRGTYCVKSLTKSKNKKSVFAIRNFSASASAGNYEQAYNYLMRGYEVKNDHKSDNLLRVGFTLLYEILENRKPIPFDELQELTFEDKPNALYWNNFCVNVVNKDYNAAKENIEISAQQQLNEQGFIGDVTRAMCDLVNKVISLQEDKALISENVERINILIEENKYEEALEGHEEILRRIKDDKLREKYNSLMELIKNIIAFKNDDNLVLNNDKIANYGNNVPKILLALYLRDNDYLRASNYIEEVCRENPDAYYQLVKKLLHELNELNISHNPSLHKISISDANYHFKKFLKVFNIEDLDMAMQELTLSITYSDPESENYLHNTELLAMFKKLKRMRENDEILEEMAINYNLKKDPTVNFNYAIEKGDYKKANAFSHIARINGSVIFDIKRKILNEMINLDKINREKPENIPPVEPPKVEPPKEEIEVKEVLKEENDQLPVVEEEKEIIQETPIPSTEPVDEIIDEELREEASNLELNYETIYDLVYNRNYELAYALVERDKERGDLDRLCGFTARLIKRIKKLEKGIIVYADYSEPTGYKLKDFYKAISNRDYDYAYSLVDDLIDELSENSKDSREIELYKLLLEDIITQQEKVENIKAELEDLNNRIHNMSIQPRFTREDIETIVEIMQRKVELKKEILQPIDIDSSLLNIAETTILSLDGRLNNTDFLEVESESEVASERFLAAIDQGDYLTAKKLIASIDWKDIEKIYNFTFLRLAKKMLNVMIPHLRFVVDQSNITDEVEEEPILEEEEIPATKLPKELTTPEKTEEFKSFLHEMRILIKDRRYEEVYQALIKTDLPVEKLENAYHILGNIAFIKGTLDHKANELYATYESSLENNDPNYLEHLNAYKKFISENYMEESKHYKQKMLKSQE